MADKKISDLTADVSPQRTDLLYKVDSTGTTDRSVALSDLLKQTLPGDITADRVRVRNSTAISLNSGAYSALSFDTENYDSNNLHSTTSNTSRLTAVKAGFYRIFAAVEWATNGAGYRLAQVVLNGVTVLAGDTIPGITGQVAEQSLYTEYQLAVNDYVEIFALQTSGGALNVNATAGYTPVFGMSQFA